MSAKRQNLTDYQTKIFGRKSHQMEGQCKATKSNADCFAEDLKPVSQKKSQNEDECRKNRCLATEARSATEACQRHFISIKEVRILSQWHLGIILIRYL